ncbi:hypothetical protein ACMD2_05022 [Ananas comosus]|uniref:Cystatin domain-containing protein n=1 Tax=Ananas comosus TaxID=4615 RepID=A0A199V4R9_ANACO|nr:hypothetical protein ACMD2_05022 [Ananas comosus]
MVLHLNIVSCDEVSTNSSEEKTPKLESDKSALCQKLPEIEKRKEVREETEEEERRRIVYEYTSGEDDDYVRPDGTRRRTREEWALYYKQIKESEGFDVDPFPGTFEFGLTALTNFEDEGLIKCAKQAIEHFNKENNTSYEFVKIEKTTCIVAAGYWYNITFLANNYKVDDVEARTQTFQAKVWYGLRGDISVSLCRLKPAPS